MSFLEINTINKKIQQTEAEISNWHNCTDTVMRTIMLSELNQRLAALQQTRHELEAASAKDAISLRIYGEDIQAGRISNRILLSALGGFQSMADSIANALHHSPTARGKIPISIKEITDFEVTGTFAGSFGITLEKRYDQLEAHSGANRLSQVLNEMFNVLETVDNSELLLSVIAPYGQRTVAHYRQWLDGLRENNVSLELDWKDDAASSRKMSLKRETAPAIISVLDSIDKIDNDEVVYQGVLTGVNVRNNSFEMSVDGVGIIKGSALLETLIAVSDKLGKEISATLIRSTSLTKTNIQKITWYLVEAE